MRNRDTTEGPILAIDPGREKCGVAVVTLDGRVLDQAIVPSRDIGAAAARLIAEHHVTRLILGDRTAAKEVSIALSSADVPLSPMLVDEHRSSEQARLRFFRENPPRGWRRLIPITLLTPPRPYDDYVAVLLAERYLAAEGKV